MSVKPIERKNSEGKVNETYTLTRAFYANDKSPPDAAVVVTAESGQVLIDRSQDDLWRQLHTCGITIEPMPQPPYAERRAAELHPPVGDQLDAAFKARKILANAIKQARAAKENGDMVAAFDILLTALEPSDEQADIDAQLQAIKDKHPKSE